MPMVVSRCQAVDLGIVLVKSDGEEASASATRQTSSAEVAASSGAAKDNRRSESSDSGNGSRNFIVSAGAAADELDDMAFPDASGVNTIMQEEFFKHIIHSEGASEAFMLGVQKRLDMSMQVRGCRCNATVTPRPTRSAIVPVGLCDRCCPHTHAGSCRTSRSVEGCSLLPVVSQFLIIAHAREVLAGSGRNMCKACPV